MKSVVTIISLILIIVLMGLSNEFEYKTYRFEDLSLEICVPKSTTVDRESIENTADVKYSINLIDPTIDYWGYIQGWNITDIENFLKKSKERSNFDYQTYNMSIYEKANIKGYKIIWAAILSNKNKVRAEEYFLVKENHKGMVLRVVLLTHMDNKVDLSKISKKVISNINW